MEQTAQTYRYSTSTLQLLSSLANYGFDVGDFGRSPLRRSFSWGDSLSQAGDQCSVPSPLNVAIPSPFSVSTVRTVPSVSDNISADPLSGAPNPTRCAFPRSRTTTAVPCAFRTAQPTTIK